MDPRRSWREEGFEGEVNWLLEWHSCV
jgi:hypothetical protein